MSRPFGDDPVRWSFVAFAAVVGVLLVVTAGTSTAAFNAYNGGWDGASSLRAEATAVDATPTLVQETDTYDTVEPSGTVAVVLSPDEAYGPAETERLGRFVREGGTLLVAEDFGSHSNDLLGDLGATARFDGRLVRDEQHNYRSSALPVATDVSNDANDSIGEGVDSLTLNYGTVVDPGNADVLVRTSEYAYLDADRDGSISGDETLTASPIVTREPIGNGTIIAVSDPSLMINAMLDRPDNRAFVRNVFAAHDRVLLDYSRSSQIPPLALAAITLRETPALQAAVGTLVVLLIGGWAGAGPLAALRRVSRSRDVDDHRLDRDALVALLREQHPDWDADRVRRVAAAVVRRRGD